MATIKYNKFNLNMGIGNSYTIKIFFVFKLFL